MIRLFLLIFLSLKIIAGIRGDNDKAVFENAKQATLKIEVMNLKSGEISHGTGFFIGDQGHLLTSSHNIWHVINNSNNEYLLTFSNSSGETFNKIEVVKCLDPDELDLCYLKIQDHRPKNYFVFDENFKLGKGNAIGHIGHCGSDYSLKQGILKDSVKVLKDYYPSLLGKHSAHVFNGDYGACNGDSGAAVFYIDGISRKNAVLLGVITGGKKGEKWNGKDYEDYYKYKYAIDIKELKNIENKKGISRDISSMVSEKKKGISERLNDARKKRDIKTYLKTLYGND